MMNVEVEEGNKFRAQNFFECGANLTSRRSQDEERGKSKQTNEF